MSSQTMSDNDTSAGSKSEEPAGAPGLSDIARQAAAGAKESVASLATEAQTQVKTAIEERVDAGADVVAEVAEAARLAADHLEASAPHLASIVRAASERVEEVADSLKGQTAEDLVRSSADFVRRQPALAFGAAAAVGFALVRLFKTGAEHGEAAGNGGSRGRQEASSRTTASAGAEAAE